MQYEDDFKRDYRFYIDIIEKYNKKMMDLYNATISVRIRDSFYSDRIVFSIIDNSSEKFTAERNQSMQDLLKELEKVIENTCNSCGRSPAKFRFEFHHYLEENQCVLCDKCFLMIDDVKIRFINSFDEFDYARFGSYFFNDGELFVMTDKQGYKTNDIKSKLTNTINEKYLTQSKYIIKGVFAGQDTGFRDVNDERIYTGDIVLAEGFINEERDPYVFEEKVRNLGNNKNKNIFNVCGIVASNPHDFKSVYKNVYQVVLDNHGAFLVFCTKIEIIGNIFYNLKRSENIDIWRKACSLSQSGYHENGFWRQHSMETVKDDLKKIKTPSFVVDNMKLSPLRKVFLPPKSTKGGFLNLLKFYILHLWIKGKIR